MRERAPAYPLDSQPYSSYPTKRSQSGSILRQLHLRSQWLAKTGSHLLCTRGRGQFAVLRIDLDNCHCQLIWLPPVGFHATGKLDVSVATSSAGRDLVGLFLHSLAFIICAPGPCSRARYGRGSVERRSAWQLTSSGSSPYSHKLRPASLEQHRHQER